MINWRLGLRFWGAKAFPALKAKPTLSTVFFSANLMHPTLKPLKSTITRSYFIDAFKHSNQKRFYATYSDLGYYPGHTENGGKREQPHFNNTKNNIIKPTLYTIVFSLIAYYGSPYLFNNTPLRYCKSHTKNFLYGLIGVNCVVFGLWQIRYYNRVLYRILQKYFLLDRNSLTRKSNASMILSAFSHQEFFHLFINMICFYSFAVTMIQIMGVADFSSMYLISGCASSLASIIFSFLTRSYGVSLGASGAISGVFAAFTALFPTANVALFIIPIPGGATTALAAFTIYNVCGCVFRWSTFDFAAHLGGTVVGYLWGKQLQKKVKRRYRHTQIRYSW